MNNLDSTIEKAIRNHEIEVRLLTRTTEYDVYLSVRNVMRDNPDIFWYVHQYHFDKDNGIISLRYRCSPERSAIIQKSIDDVVEKDFQINYVRTLTQLEQVAYVYKWMLTYCNYNANSVYNQNIDSVFVRRNSVCTGYAKAAQYLFKLLGIESCLVFGRLNNDKEDGRHCWNIVNIEGHYYHLDVCFGDLILENVLNEAGIIAIQRYGNYNYNCFCVSTDEILKTRSIEDVETLPLCDSNLPVSEIERLSRIDIQERNGLMGCQLKHIGSSADIFLCTRDKNVILKKFRGNDSKNCREEYGFMECLKGCKHLLHLNNDYSDVGNNILAMEQSTPIVDLFCSHYYRPTLNGVLKMITDITLGWLECQQKGILYRDIHVCNIYKANDGMYKLGDFGSCTYKIRGQRERVGNPWFMSPETYINGQFDECSAVYSITVVLYFILNGLCPPFINGNNEKEALQRKMDGESLPEPTLLHSFPNGLGKFMMLELFEKGCAFYPSNRIQTCEELFHFMVDLRSILKSQRIELRFTQQDTESILYNKTIPNVYISRDIHHRYAYGEDVERIAIRQKWSPYSEGVERSATTAAPSSFDFDGDGCIQSDLDLNNVPAELSAVLEGDDENSNSVSDEAENYCRTMGMPESSSNRRCINGHLYDRHIYGEQCPFCPGPKNYNKVLPITVLPKSVDSSNDFWHIRIGHLISNEIENRKLISFEYSVNDIEKEESQSAHSSVDRISRYIKRMIRFHKSKPYDNIYSSIFAPAEVKFRSHMLVQVYLHLLEETEKVKALAQESDRNAERRDNIPLQCKLKKGDKVDVLLNIYGETLLLSDKKNVVWQGSFTKCSFDYFIPKNIDVDELSCVALLSINGVPVGEMRFITKIVDTPRLLNPEIIAHKYKKVFISYSHQDESKVKFLHEGLELGSVPHFFDRKYLKVGDVFPKVIQDYIKSSDLFILCWSENASNSEYVQKERLQALERAYPQVQPEQAAKLRIYPMSIEPRAELPSDMKNYYHFGEL